MIQYPINVTPQDAAVDATQNIIVNYTFQGDYLSKNIIRVYDYDTGALTYTTVLAPQSFIGYNGDQCGFTIPANSLTNGHKYILQMCMIQFTLDNQSPLANMPVFGDKVKESSTGSVVYVDGDITSIYPWNETDGEYKPTVYSGSDITGMKIKINGVERTITSYKSRAAIGDVDYGIIAVDSPFGFNITDGMDYEIYSNFYITPQYFFATNALPVVTLSQTCYSERIIVSGTYTQTQNVMIKKYNLKLYWSNNSGFVDNTGSSQDTGLRTRLMEETNDIYSQNIQYVFWNPYYHDMNNDNFTTDYYKIVCEVTTQNNVVRTYNQIFSITPNDYSDVSGANRGNILYDFKVWWDKEKGAVYHSLRGYGSTGEYCPAGTYELFREDLESGEIIKLHPHHYTHTGEYGAELVGYDITASTHGKYRYTLMKFDDTQGYRGGIIIPVHDESYTGDTLFPSATIEIDECSYYVTELDMFQFNDALIHPNEKAQQTVNFRIGDTWQFMCEIENTTVVNNLDRMTHVGYSRYISSTSTPVNYMSGTLTAMLGYMNCAEKKFIDTIATVRAWRDFITQPKAFLLKSQKGDVWVVNVTDNPQTNYDESYKSIPTTFTFSWAECMSILDTCIYNRDNG